MSTLDLFADYTPPQTAPYVRSSDTSREAAESIEPHLAHLERVVLDAVAGTGPAGATCDEIERATGLSHQTASARVRGLFQKRKIETTGDRRPTRSGRNAQVYRAVGGRS